jgi:hypothetical protein
LVGTLNTNIWQATETETKPLFVVGKEHARRLYCANLPITIVSLLYYYQRYLFSYVINDCFILFIISAIYNFDSISVSYLFLYVLPKAGHVERYQLQSYRFKPFFVTF